MSEPRAVRRWVRIPLAVSGVMRSAKSPKTVSGTLNTKKTPHSRTPFSTKPRKAESKRRHLILEVLFLSYDGEDVSEPRAVRRWVRIPLAVSGVMRSAKSPKTVSGTLNTKKTPHSRTPFSPPTKRNFCLPKVPFLFIQAAGLVYHRRTTCGVYHQPL